MTRDEIIRMAMELGQAIAASDEVQDLKDMQDKLQQDPQAFDLIMRYQEARMKMDNKRQDGLIIGNNEESHISILEQQLQSNAIIQEMVKSQETFDNLMQAVYFAMNQALSGGCGSECSGCCDSCGS